MPITKMRIEGLLAAFPKLLGGGGEHTFIETEAVRYLYQVRFQHAILCLAPFRANGQSFVALLNTVTAIGSVVRCTDHEQAIEYNGRSRHAAPVHQTRNVAFMPLLCRYFVCAYSILDRSE